ncbi:MAG: hypothetical protein LBJ84_05235 [Oscillospiraceae bacterium]|jgi:hypothetical protein|nr:hypothetical protein [Oscillospiraceae bacterium]
MRKRILSIVLAIAIAVGLCGTISASAMEKAPGFELQWANTQSVTLALSFSNGNANASCIISGKSNAASISATFSLREKNSNGTYTTVHTWPSAYVSGKTLTFSDTASATQGKTYRLYVSATVTSSAGVAEAVSDYYEKTYS